MTTFAQMIDDTLMQLTGFSTFQDQATYLTEAIDTDDLTIPVADATAVSRGLIEIGSELIQVDGVNTTSGSLTIPPYGRGYRSSTAASHASGTRVVSSPMFPRTMVKKALNDAIKSVYPELFAIGSTIFSFQPSITAYNLPAGALDVLQIRWQSTGPSKEWMPVRRYDVDKHAAVSEFANGVAVNVYDGITPGRSIKVTFTKEPEPLNDETDVFTTVTGLPASCEDLIRFGAAYRLVPFFDSARLSGQSAESDFGGANRQPSGASQLSRFLLQMYQVRLAEETKSLQSVFPIRSHYTR
jgi:hypothetical protein